PVRSSAMATATQEFVFPPPPTPSVEITGTRNRFPVRSILSYGRNYADHAGEMDGYPKAEPPFFFTNPADAIVPSGAIVPYPSRTENLHHEVELVVAIGSAGCNITPGHAREYIFGYAVGNDLTRRDLQGAAKKKG